MNKIYKMGFLYNRDTNTKPRFVWGNIRKGLKLVNPDCDPLIANDAAYAYYESYVLITRTHRSYFFDY